MQFAFNLFNHTELGQTSLHDPVMIIMHQLKALGHVCGLAKNTMSIDSRMMNVLTEGFTEWSAGVIEEMHAKGARFVIIATEEPTAKGFNHGIMKGMVDRQRVFPRVARLADAIWCLVPGTEEWYGQFAPAAHVELGYAPSLVRSIQMMPDKAIGFFGSLSQRREKILRRLARATGREDRVHAVCGFIPQADRDIQVSRARVIVQIRSHEAMGLVSSSRCNTALHIGRPVVAEPHALADWWKDVIQFSASTEEFVGDVIKASAIWRQMHADQFDKFKRLLSPERCIGHALETTGLLSGRIAA